MMPNSVVFFVLSRLPEHYFWCEDLKCPEHPFPPAVGVQTAGAPFSARIAVAVQDAQQFSPPRQLLGSRTPWAPFPAKPASFSQEGLLCDGHLLSSCQDSFTLQMFVMCDKDDAAATSMTAMSCVHILRLTAYYGIS